MPLLAICPPTEDACTSCCMDTWVHGCKQDQYQMGRWGEGPGPPPEEEASARERSAEDTSCSKAEDTGLLHRRPCSKEGKIDATEREMHKWRVALFQMANHSPLSAARTQAQAPASGTSPDSKRPMSLAAKDINSALDAPFCLMLHTWRFGAKHWRMPYDPSRL